MPEAARPRVTVLDAALDIFRMRQYFDIAVRAGQLATAARHDSRFLVDAVAALLGLPTGRPSAGDPFPPAARFEPRRLAGPSIGVVSTGGSGALASLVGVARALEEAELTPSVYSVCSGSALFAFPLAAGLSAADAADLVLRLRPADYIDVDWARLATRLPLAGRGWGGLLAGDALEAYYRAAFGDLRLRQLRIPAYAPIWNVEANRLEYLGPSTYPDLTVARAVRMSVSLPLFFAPAQLDGGYWCDGGIVDIFPVHPVLDLAPTPASVLALNGFYPPGFAGEDATGWQHRAGSILRIASQVRTCQRAQLARENLARLTAATDVIMIEPVPYQIVAGAGFYHQFVTTRQWPDFMRAGRRATRHALRTPAHRRDAA